MNDSKIFPFFKTNESKLESLNQQIMKIDGHLKVLLREKLTSKLKNPTFMKPYPWELLEFFKIFVFKLNQNVLCIQM